VREIAWKAQMKLCGRFRSLTRKGKLPNVVATAIARDLSAFIWAINREVRGLRAHAGHLARRTPPVCLRRYGVIGQNVYLFCASEGLATVFRGSVDSKKLGATMQLGDGQFTTFAQFGGISARVNRQGEFRGQIDLEERFNSPAAQVRTWALGQARYTRPRAAPCLATGGCARSGRTRPIAPITLIFRWSPRSSERSGDRGSRATGRRAPGVSALSRRRRAVDWESRSTTS
jgi:hypothetical protein